MSVYKCVYPCFEQWAQTRITRAWATEREWPYHRKTTMTSTQESRITWQERGSQVGRGLVATGCTHDAAARQGSVTILSLPPLSHLDRVQYCILPVRCFRDHRYYTRTQRLLSPYSITERAALCSKFVLSSHVGDRRGKSLPYSQNEDTLPAHGH